MQIDIQIGLNEIGGNPNLTFISFIAMVVIAVLGVRFGLYAFLNMRATELTDQRPLWEYLFYVGGVSAMYGLLGILEIISTIRTVFKQGLMLALILLVALAIREIYFNATLSNRASTRDEAFAARRPLELSFVAIVAVVIFGIGIFGENPVLFLIQGFGALLFAGYGFWFGQQQAQESMVQGTMIDSLLRHLLPVLAFGTLVPAIDLATAAGLERIIVRHVQIIFVIMTATSLMTATIKLRQNLASL
jgi:hypothetical protein